MLLVSEQKRACHGGVQCPHETHKNANVPVECQAENKRWEAHDQLKQHYAPTKMTAFLACTSTHKDTNSKHKLCLVRAYVKLAHLDPHTHTQTLLLPKHRAALRVTQHRVPKRYRGKAQTTRWVLRPTGYCIVQSHCKSLFQINTKTVCYVRSWFETSICFSFLNMPSAEYQKLSRTIKAGILVQPCFSLYFPVLYYVWIKQRWTMQWKEPLAATSWCLSDVRVPTFWCNTTIFCLSLTFYTQSLV